MHTDFWPIWHFCTTPSKGCPNIWKGQCIVYFLQYLCNQNASEYVHVCFFYPYVTGAIKYLRNNDVSWPTYVVLKLMKGNESNTNNNGFNLFHKGPRGDGSLGPKRVYVLLWPPWDWKQAPSLSDNTNLYIICVQIVIQVYTKIAESSFIF